MGKNERTLELTEERPVANKKVDWDKVKTVDDVRAIVKAIKLDIMSHEEWDNYEILKPYLTDM